MVHRMRRGQSVWRVQPVPAHTLTPAYSRLCRSRAWRWNLKHLCPTLGQPAPFKVSYTSESSLLMIARLNQRWMWELAAKSPHWIRTHQRHRLIILWLIVHFFFHVCSAADSLWLHYLFHGDNGRRRPVHGSNLPNASPQKQCCFFYLFLIERQWNKLRGTKWQDDRACPCVARGLRMQTKEALIN